MPRINLSISQQLFNELQVAANAKKVPVNLIAVQALEQLFIKQTVNYSAFITQIEKDIDALPKEKNEFILSDLDSYTTLSISTVDNGEIKPSVLRATIGKAFNELVRNNSIKGVTRTYTTGRNGKQTLKFSHGAAVYSIDRKARSIEE